MASRLPRKSPESLGIPSASLLKLIQRWERQEVHSFMVVRHGAVAAEGAWAPYKIDSPHVLYSLSKSFAATAVGLAVGEGRLGLDDRLADHFPDKMPASPGENLRQMRVRDLLSMSCGHQTEAWPGRGWGEGSDLVSGFLAHPVPDKPGQKFFYNSLATYMCSALVQKLTGQRIRDYLGPRLLQPLGIETPEWDQSPEKVDFGGWGLHLRTEDIAKFGQLCLQNGVWEGKRLIPSTWIAQASAKQVSNGDSGSSDWSHGYGFQFWRCKTDCYRGDGAYGQLCVVMPQFDCVVAVTASVDDIQAELDAIWEELMPALAPAPLPPSSDHNRLISKCEGLRLALPQPAAGAKWDEGLAGSWRLTGSGPFDRLEITASATGVHLEFDGQGEGDVVAGFKDWTPGEMQGEAVAAACAYAPGGLAMRIKWTGGPLRENWTITRTGDKLAWSLKRQGRIGAPGEESGTGERITHA